MPFRREETAMQGEKLTYLINRLLSERDDLTDISLPNDENRRFNLFRSLVNIREAKPIDEDFIRVQDELLRGEISRKGITDYKSIPTIESHIRLWQGDITTLECGAIVNAANSGLTGCYCPCHSCIDNAIHTFSGVQLRLECDDIMRRQGYPEPVGRAKVTNAYNLPCKYIIHTVGPIVEGNLGDYHINALRQCYRACLEAAVEKNIDSIAFCCISTGEFHFPNRKAAEIAIETVREFLTNNTIEVIFNVFKSEDYKLYGELLGAGKEAKGSD
jgi:O-acetyl-ADP-ribose deacetylase (regulator of RNase III)